MTRSVWMIGGGWFLLALLFAVHGCDILRCVLGLPIYRVVDYDPGLTREAATAKPVIAALNRYYHQHGRFPDAASRLAPYLPSGLANPAALKNNIINAWVYRSYYGNDYQLGLVSGREEPMLRYKYEGSKGHWVYDNGSTEIPIRLNP